MRAFSSGKVDSVSSNLGASTPEIRATPFLAASQAISTCRVKGSMSGASRYCSRIAGSNLRASAWARPLSRIWLRLPSMVLNTGKLAEDIDIVIESPG